MGSAIEVAIIGAGPNGLSLAAHLAARRIEFRIFGEPMQSWHAHMPPGMHLKSDGKSSDLSDPSGQFRIGEFCARSGLDYHATEKPIPLATFVAYGLAFQRRFVPQLERKILIALERTADSFVLRFADGESAFARRVVLATGIAPFAYLPDFLADIPSDYVSHASAYGALDRFGGEEVMILGGGASAVDLAALLKDNGAEASLVTRRGSLEFLPPPGPRSLTDRLRWPDSGMGGGWQLLAFARQPLIFHALPAHQRFRKAATMLGPSAGWFMKDRIVGRMPIRRGLTPLHAAIKNGRVHLDVRTLDGDRRALVTRHLIAATGYRIDVRRLRFLPPSIQAKLRTIDHAPVLSRSFESSLPGLYFIGPVAVHSFGPLVRFVLGTKFQARRLSNHLAASLGHARGRSANVHEAADQDPIASEEALRP